MTKKWTGLSLPLIAMLILFPMACSEKAEIEDLSSNQATQSPAVTSRKAEEKGSRDTGGTLKGGQEVKMHPFTLVVPGDWQKNKHLDFWCPAAEADSRTPSDHNLTQGARPPTMLNSSDLIEGIKTSIGADPQDLKMIKIGGMNGATCGWEKGKYQSVGLFLQEKNPMFDIPILHFFILRAPKETFSQYEKTYWAILESIRL
jgi:hypothetical protein